MVGIIIVIDYYYYSNINKILSILLLFLSGARDSSY
jgi:hypothetical protein